MNTKLVVFFMIMILFLFTCVNENILQNNETKIQILIHDSPFKLQDKNVESLDITVKRIEIIKSGTGEKIVLLNEEKKMNILEITANNPVILSTVAVEPGSYEQLRLILTDENTITVDGETFPIRIPSGEQSGLKFDGPFNIPAGKLFKITFDFNPQESVIYNKAQGYKLKPVITIAGISDILGYFNGILAVSHRFGVTETVFELREDNSFRMKVSDYPNYNINGKYYYDSLLKTIKFDNFSLNAPGLSSQAISNVMRNFPSNFNLNVIQWRPEELLIIDLYGNHVYLYKSNDFSFSDAIKYTKLDINVKYPDTSKDGKNILIKLNFKDESIPPITAITKLIGDTVTANIEIQDGYFLTDTLEVKAEAYILYNIDEDLKLNMGFEGDKAIPVLDGAYLYESTDNGWTSQNYFSIKKSQYNASDVVFSGKLNIKLTPSDFSITNPVISWNKHPYSTKYCVLALVKKEEQWVLVFQKLTTDTSLTLNINKLTTDINTGDKLRIEVYALDDSGTLDTSKKTGAYLMDSITVTK